MKIGDMRDSAKNSWHHKLARAVQTLRSHPAWPLSLLLCLILASIGVFVDLAEDVHNAERITVLDQQLADWLHVGATPLTTQFMLVVSDLHDVIPMSILTLLVGAILLKTGARDWLLGLVLVVPGGILINTLFKYLFARARPQFVDPIVSLASFSFPSGHVSGSTLFYGFLAALLISRSHSRRRNVAIVSAAMAMVLLVAASRMYLGAHFLSDVLAAFFESLAWLGICLIGVQMTRRWRNWTRAQN
ncbi:MAG TPA: phosphatase PAP2 family protein [Dokdonella sp.]|uniref:phosphatase PAP2 family protein n=1 Tax=Dokdonella sp. TaxID=2291710 RepID=UPI002D7F8D2A|nr:phosphatase PAP2 family protein [Dokdonella sp.]HET9032660.1 phosphatase PAP2 family protein [Dokdonella sp.]